MSTIRAADLPRPPLAWLALLALPMVGLAVLIARPELDLEWRHQPSHFWLVLLVAVVNVALAYLTNEAAMRRGDARLVLISLAFGASAGFLGLHALATPGVLLPVPEPRIRHRHAGGSDDRRSVLAAAAALPLGGPRGELVASSCGLLRGGLLAVLVAWGAASILGVPGFVAQAAPDEVAPPLRLAAVAGGGPVRVRRVALPAPPRPCAAARSCSPSSSPSSSSPRRWSPSSSAVTGTCRGGSGIS